MYIPLFSEDPSLAGGLQAVVSSVSKQSCVRAAVLDLSGLPRYAGYNDQLFCYTASLPKLFVDLEVAWQIHTDQIHRTKRITVDEKNCRPFDTENGLNPALALKVGDREGVEVLRKRMIEYSCDTSANLLIDLVTREKINAQIAKFGWFGSEVRRKFLPRRLEDPPYNDPKMPTTAGCAKHLVEFMFNVQMRALVSSRQSHALFMRLLSQHDKTKIASVLPSGTMFAHKTGWLYDPDVHPSVWCQADCGIVHDKDKHYIVAVIVNELPKEEALEILREVARGIHALF